MIVYLATRDQFDVHARYLASWGRQVAPRLQLMSYEELFNRRRLPEATWVFADLERLGVADREQAAQVWRTLERDLPACRLLNHPLRARRRYSLLRALREAGVNDFDVFRVEEPRRPARYPVFVRRENEHEGALSGLLDSSDAVDREVEMQVDRGVAPDDLLIVEYAADPDPSGRYWKYSAFRIGERLVPGHLFVSHDWVVRAPLVADTGIIEAETAYVEEFPHCDALRRVFDIAAIDFGRVDYAVTDRGIRVFEINTHPMIMGADDNHAASRALPQRRSAALLAAALTELDGPTSRRAVAAPRLTPRPLSQSGWRFRQLYRLLRAVGAGSLAPSVHLRTTAWARRLAGAVGGRPALGRRGRGSRRRR
jgi:hypothetical protein